MDQETARYIVQYFSKLLTAQENIALKHAQYSYKLKDEQNLSSERKKFFEERGLITSDPFILDLLKDGYAQFELNVARRIMVDHADDVYLNTCRKCGKLARTPQATQCRHCAYTWRHTTLAHFKLLASFQLHGRSFFLVGEVLRGEIKIGHHIDLRILGLNKMPRIEVIEFVRKQQDGYLREDIALGVNELTHEEKEFLKELGSFGKIIDIVPLVLWTEK